MTIKWPKITLESSLKNENVANFMLFNLSVPEFLYLIIKNIYDVISGKK